MRPEDFTLVDFIKESNRIEGILREPTDQEVFAHEKFLSLAKVTIPAMEELVSKLQPDAILREHPSHMVQVGGHVAPKPGQSLVYALEDILVQATLKRRDKYTPYKLHSDYEYLHPFTDGNGRSGRALWLWYMGGIRRAPLGFLHHWYYQTLDYRNDKGMFYGADGIR